MITHRSIPASTVKLAHAQAIYLLIYCFLLYHANRHATDIHKITQEQQMADKHTHQDYACWVDAWCSSVDMTSANAPAADNADTCHNVVARGPVTECCTKPPRTLICQHLPWQTHTNLQSITSQLSTFSVCFTGPFFPLHQVSLGLHRSPSPVRALGL